MNTPVSKTAKTTNFRNSFIWGNLDMIFHLSNLDITDRNDRRVPARSGRHCSRHRIARGTAPSGLGCFDSERYKRSCNCHMRPHNGHYNRASRRCGPTKRRPVKILLKSSGSIICGRSSNLRISTCYFSLLCISRSNNKFRSRTIYCNADLVAGLADAQAGGLMVRFNMFITIGVTCFKIWKTIFTIRSNGRFAIRDK